MLENLAVVLVSPRNPLNIGAAARAMSNFGCFDLRLVNPYDVAYREAKSAVRAGYILERARAFSTLAEALDGCSLVVGTTSAGSRVPEHPVRRLEQAGELLREHIAHHRAALLFGSEKFGLGNDDLSHCHWLTRIPTRDEHASMNLGQSVAVCLYELIRAGTGAAPPNAPNAKPPATAGETERLTTRLIEVLAQAGYVHARITGSTELKTRRLIRRMQLSGHDTEVCLGMLRQIAWKLSQCYPDSE